MLIPCLEYPPPPPFSPEKQQVRHIFPIDGQYDTGQGRELERQLDALN